MTEKRPYLPERICIAAPNPDNRAIQLPAGSASSMNMLPEKKVILLVEDNLDDVRLAKRSFRENRIANDVVVMNDGASALDYLERASANPGSDLPALTLLDLNLPKLDGLQVLQRIRANPRLRRLPVVILTCSKEESDLVRSYDLGANSYVQKPVEFDLFNEAVRQLGIYWLLLNEAPPRSVS